MIKIPINGKGQGKMENYPEKKTPIEHADNGVLLEIIETSNQKKYPEETRPCSDVEVQISKPEVKKLPGSVTNCRISIHNTKKCEGCKRWQKDGGDYEFEKIIDTALPRISYLGTAKPSDENPELCEVCAEWKKLEGKTRVKTEQPGERSLNFFRWCRQGRDLTIYEEGGPRKYNPLWSGKDASQIGVFIRNFRILGINESEKVISVHFYLNVVWLDRLLCESVKKKREFTGDDWNVQMTPAEYEKEWKLIKYKKRGDVHWEGPCSNSLMYPVLEIWDTTDVGIDERQNVLSLNKKWIGRDTVYWRRLIRTKINHSFKCRSYPYGYELFKLKIRLISYTHQHLVLFRTKLWYDEHVKQVGVPLAAHSFSYVHPDASLLTDWTVCSVHGWDDRWYCPFDNNDLSYSLPVHVSHGLDTQSCFEAIVVLKRLPLYAVLNIWVWFTLTSTVALLTYQLEINDMADRLAIAVGIIFIQMQLKIQSAEKTPRMQYITALDIHMWLSILMVVVQAIAQVSVFATVKSSLVIKIDTSMFHWNLIFVVVINVMTYCYAKYGQSSTRQQMQKCVENLTGFQNSGPNKFHNTLSLYQDGMFPHEDDIYRESGMKISGYHSFQPLRCSKQYLQQRIERQRLNQLPTDPPRTYRWKISNCLRCPPSRIEWQ